MMNRKTWKALPKQVMAFLLCFVFALSAGFASISRVNANNTYEPFVNDHGINPQMVATEEERASSVKKSHEFNVEVEAEGMVLLKNEADALPLAKGSDISLFGKNSHHIVYGGSGSSSTGGIYGQQFLSYYARNLTSGRASNATGSNEQKIEIEDGGVLTTVSKFNVNKELSDFYSTYSRSGPTKNAAVGANDPPRDFSTREIYPDDIDPDAKASYATDYKDAAILTISRLGGEGFDMPRQFTTTGPTVGNSITDSSDPVVVTEDTSGAKKSYSNSNWPSDDKFHHALEPELQELAMAEYIKKPTDEGGAGFDKLILLVNTGTPMELGELEQYADAILWIGLPGASGLTAVAKALVGDVNPSGKLVDTWAKDMIKTPAVQDFGSNLIINEDRDALITGATVYGGDGNGGASTRYQEDIYVGYRYYETRGFVEDDDCAWYDNEVAYPFGYGLSYTTFQWQFRSGTVGAGDSTNRTKVSKNDNVRFTIRVQNNGAVAGKDVLQVYASAPYFANGIEKSHVVLVGYAKTGLINPGSTQDVTINVPINDLASYDWNDANGNEFKGYEVEAGEYRFFVARDAHSAWANPSNPDLGNNTYVSPYTNSLSRIVEVEELDNEFEEDAVIGANGFAIKTSATGYAIVNQFDDVSLGWFGGPYAAEPGPTDTTAWDGFERMSRTDFEGTFPKTPVAADLVLPANTASVNYNNATPVNAAYDTNVPGARVKPWITSAEPTGNNGDVENNPATQQEIVLADLVTVPKNDPLWDAFMDQFSFDQLSGMLNGYYMMGGIDGEYSAVNNMPNFGLSSAFSPDGPTGITSGGSFNVGNTNTCYYASPIVVSSTWNLALAEKLGESIGDEALVVGNSAIYAPAMNTHRNPFSGRNFEYYSEDGFIAGKTASAVVKGMQSKGLIPSIKHFALNDQDTDRDTVGGLYTWASEQAMREIYLKAFQIPVEEGKALSVMSAFNRVGATPASASYPLLTEVLRNEWGFEGYVVTDWWGNNQGIGKGWSNFIAGIRAGNDMALGTIGASAKRPAATQGTASNTTGLRNTHIAAVRKAAKNVLFAQSRSNTVFRSNAGTIQNIDDLFDIRIDVSSNKALYWNKAQHTTGFKVSYRLSEGSVLPLGFKLDPMKGIIRGTEANFETFNVAIDTMVTTSGLVGTWRYATIEYTVNSGLSANSLPELTFNNQSFTGTVGTLFMGTINTMVASNGAAVSSKIVEGSLPAGLVLDTKTGMIVGTPTAAGSSTFTVESAINGGLPLSAEFTITIGAATGASQGLDGATWHFGTTTPGNDLGNDGDFYLNSTNFDVYAKDASEWSLIGNIAGEDGADGADGPIGPQGPQGPQGEVTVDGCGSSIESFGGSIAVFFVTLAALGVILTFKKRAKQD